MKLRRTDPHLSAQDWVLIRRFAVVRRKKVHDAFSVEVLSVLRQRQLRLEHTAGTCVFERVVERVHGLFRRRAVIAAYEDFFYFRVFGLDKLF